MPLIVDGPHNNRQEQGYRGISLDPRVWVLCVASDERRQNKGGQWTRVQSGGHGQLNRFINCLSADLFE